MSMCSVALQRDPVVRVRERLRASSPRTGSAAPARGRSIDGEDEHLDRQRIGARQSARCRPRPRVTLHGDAPRAGRGDVARARAPDVDRDEREQRRRARPRANPRDSGCRSLSPRAPSARDARTATTRSQEREVARKRTVADEDAPADVQARHGRIRIEADARERPTVVAREADGVGDAETGHEPRRRGRERDVDDERHAERDEQQRPQLAIEAAGASRASQTRMLATHRCEPEHVVGREEPRRTARSSCWSASLVEETELALAADHVPGIGERVLRIGDRPAANREVERIDGGPQRKLAHDEPRRRRRLACDGPSPARRRCAPNASCADRSISSG